jgi:iron(III) transport system substrate-binding protein
VLRRLGWTEGWAALRRIFANSRYFTATSSKVPVDVSAGEAAAGMCIDFYGRSQCSAIGAQRLGYVDPPFMTAITADPISFLRGAPHQPIAQQFIGFVLAPEGQRLWQARRGTPGGPERFELRRLPIRRDLYTPEEMKNWADQTKPFEIAKPYPPGTPDYFLTIAPLSHAMAIDVHSDLIAAWEALCRNPKHPQRQKMLDLFYGMPPELTLQWSEPVAGSWKQAMENASDPRHEQVVQTLKAFLAGVTAPWADKDRLLADRLRWTEFFRDQYRQVVRLAGE